MMVICTRQTQIIALSAIGMIAILCCPVEALAQSGSSPLFGSVTNFLTALQELLTGTWARLIAIIAIALLGFAWMNGHITWSVAMATIAGIILVFSAAAIVDSISRSI